MLSLTYLSSATNLLSPSDLEDILTTSRTNNAARGITGVLLYRDGNFVQTLEGPDEAVEQTYARIGSDSRHRSIIEAWRESTRERSFPDWSMGFRRIDRADAASVPGLNDFLDGGRPTVAAGGSPFTAEVFYRVFRDGPRY